MQIRNPIYTATGNIDCEIEHPQFGWIPFTASKDDPEEHGRLIYAAALEIGPGPYVPAPPDLATFTAAIDAHVEQQARAWSYNSAAHLASYATSTVPQWSAEASAFVAWRDAAWLAALAMLDAVQAGGDMPDSPAAFIATLPVITRPTE